MVESLRDAQRKLYQWREEFFHDKFKSKYFDPDLPLSNWITLGLDDAHAYYTVPYQITQNFNEVMNTEEFLLLPFSEVKSYHF